MIFSEIKKYYNFLISLGINEHTDKREAVKIRLFYGCCYVWYIIVLLLITRQLLAPEVEYINAAIHLGFICITIIAQILHYYKYYAVAYALYLMSLIASPFIFSNFIYQGRLLEFYYALVPPLALILIDNKITNYAILLFSYSCFIVPNLILDHYPDGDFDKMTNSFLFFCVFILVNYFKTLNKKNERILENRTEELKNKTKELENLNAFQSQFFANITHEIRTPLTLIKGQIDKLNIFSTSFPEAIDVKENLNRQVHKITKMVDDVLDLAKMEVSGFTLELKPINLSELINSLYLSFEPLFKQKNIHFELIKTDETHVINANAVYLERALNNIIVNALKYTQKKGAVRIEVQVKNQNAIINIKDNGIGISKEDIDKITNRFYQADNDINKAGGTGIGLAFSKEIIERHQGTLQIKSELKEGSNFKITLPLVKNVDSGLQVNIPEKVIPVSENVREVLPAKDHVFLIVDDNAEMRTYLKSIFEGSHCLEAENGLEALDILKQHTVNLIITDYMMPKMNGLQLITALKIQQFQMPVLMLTARTDKESKLDVLRLGIDDYITKPFEAEELLIRVHNALKNHKNMLDYREEEKLTSDEIRQSNQWIHNVKDYIEEKATDPKFTQLDIADHFNLSKSSLYRKIKGETGLSPNELIVEIKLQKARKIIKDNPEISLKRLSLEVGYSHSYYFSKTYHKRFGHSPLRK